MMNSVLKQEIIEAFRVGGLDIPDIARSYGVPETQVEKVIFPNGRQRRVLPVVLPKIAKEITTLYGADGIIRIPSGIKKLVPLSESRLKIVHRVKAPADQKTEKPAGSTPSKAKTPEGRLGALKAWETIRKQKAEARGETYIPRSLEELKRLAGIQDDIPYAVVQTVAKPVVQEQKSEVVKVQPSAITVEKVPVVEERKEDELEIDYKPVVEMGRVVDAYCKQHGITLKELLESHQQLGLITKLLNKPT